MEFLESHYLYLGLMIFSLSYPLAQSFEWRISLYKKWKALGVATLVMMAVFIPWDIWFTTKGVWWFNDDYTIGLKILHLPIEEWLFFIIIPYACIFIFEVLNFYIKKDILKNIARPFLLLMASALAMLSIIYSEQLYTFTTFSITSIALFITAYFNPKWLGKFLLGYFVSLIPFLLINGILTGSLIKSPIVNYNPQEIIGLRILLIPIEDSIYNILMLLNIMWIYQSFKKPETKN